TTDVAISTTGDDSDAGGTITDAEYFVDTVGADGTGQTMTRNRTATVVSEDAVLAASAVTALGEGKHDVFVHSKDSLGLWGPTLDIPLVVDVTGPAVDAASVGPNPSNGVLSDKSNPGYLVVSAQITDRDAGGQVQSTLADAEAFLDPKVADPAGGTGLQLLAVDGKLDASTEAVYGLIPVSQVKALTEGTHHVFVRGQDAAGNWGPLYAVNLVVDKTAPVLGALTATPNPTGGATTVTLSAPVTEANGLARAEFWTGTTDPGVGNATALPVSIVNNQVVVTVPTAGLPTRTTAFNLRVQDTAGNWSKAASTQVSVTRPNRIFASGFETVDPAWSATSGRASITSAAAMPTAAEPGSTRGLQVTFPGGRSNLASYLTDTTPTAETTYHARFVFDPSTLTPGKDDGTVLTVFDAQNTTRGSAFTLQLRVSRGARQVRTALTRSTGGALYGAWVTLASGPRTLQLDWTSATAGSLQLSVDGRSVSTLSGNTSTLRVETARLGVSAGFTTSTSGAARFDSFTSARDTL
ncbi:MAG: hypothetical protein WCD35_11670, partial [Mycobacteriales bacterium]